MTEDEAKNPAALTILPMVPEDLDEVIPIEEKSYPNPWSRNVFSKELKNPVSLAYSGKVDADGGEVLAAYIFFWIVYGEAHILNLTVREDFRRRGFARRLMDFTLAFMEEKGVKEVFLEVRPSNKAAIALYESFGFRQFYVRKKYYGDEDANVMGLTIQEEEFVWERR